jgi:peptide/nickel transport system permease protein
MDQHSGREFSGPITGAWLGTDHLGRDLSAQLAQGVRVALAVGVLAAGGAVMLGTLMGMIGAWFRGWIDQTVLWISSTVVAIPGILLVIAIASVLDKGILALVLAFTLVSWVSSYRLIRAEVMRLKSMDFVTAAKASGASTVRILGGHLLPHLWPLIKVQFSLSFIWAIQTEAILSFLGVGLAEAPSWGRMIADAWAWNDLGSGHIWRLASATLALAGLSLAVQRLTAMSSNSAVPKSGDRQL